jgi:hypothetical protein
MTMPVPVWPTELRINEMSSGRRWSNILYKAQTYHHQIKKSPQILFMSGDYVHNGICQLWHEWDTCLNVWQFSLRVVIPSFMCILQWTSLVDASYTSSEVKCTSLRLCWNRATTYPAYLVCPRKDLATFSLICKVKQDSKLNRNTCVENYLYG